jgi:hypothetical protein
MQRGQVNPHSKLQLRRADSREGRSQAVSQYNARTGESAGKQDKFEIEKDVRIRHGQAQVPKHLLDESFRLPIARGGALEEVPSRVT